jgi:TRAP-type mannitol/chloroaromatic compound transport system permease small subunit
MRFLYTLVRLSEGLIKRTGRITSWCTSALVLVVCYDVFTRYFLKRSSVAVQELEWHIFAVIFLTGAAYTMKKERHVRVDLLYSRLSAKGKAWINLVGCFIFLLPFSYLVIWASYDFVINSLTIQETSPNPGGLPARYLIKACIPFGFLLIILQAIATIIKSILLILDMETGSL